MISCALLNYDLDENDEILTDGDVPNAEQSWDDLWLEDDDGLLYVGHCLDFLYCVKHMCKPNIAKTHNLYLGARSARRAII